MVFFTLLRALREELQKPQYSNTSVTVIMYRSACDLSHKGKRIGASFQSKVIVKVIRPPTQEPLLQEDAESAGMRLRCSQPFSTDPAANPRVYDPRVPSQFH